VSGRPAQGAVVGHGARHLPRPDQLFGGADVRAVSRIAEPPAQHDPVRGVCIREAEEGGADTVLIETVGMHGDPSNFDLPAVPAFSSLRRKVEPKPGPDGERYALLQLSGYGLRSSRTVLDGSGTGAWAPQPRPMHHYSPVSGGA
jgi:hypothetical protein